MNAHIDIPVAQPLTGIRVVDFTQVSTEGLESSTCPR